MCGRYKGPETWAELHQVLGSFTHQPDIFEGSPYEIRPTNRVPICIRNHQGQFEWIKARWSLIPHWHHGAIKEWKATSFNAKIEEAPAKPSFRAPWKSKHCVIPASSFWEWSGAHPSEKGKKQRYELTRGDNQPLAFAGLWDIADTLDGEVISCTILTKAPGPDFEGFHDREAVALHPDLWFDWLECVPMPEISGPSAPGTWRKVPVATDCCAPEPGPGGQPGLF